MASTGFNLEADTAGIIPEINPITTEIPKPSKILPPVIIKSKSIT